VELQAFRRLTGTISAYGNSFYLFSPKERIQSTGFSVPDAYSGRAGLEYAFPSSTGISVSLGGRIEGVPGTDAFGGSRGSRRPGFAVSVEPGLIFNKGRFLGPDCGSSQSHDYLWLGTSRRCCFRRLHDNTSITLRL
jgi:hypothetical protein